MPERRPISIWRPTDDGAGFERPAPLPFGDHYAATRRIAARKAPGASRVCLFGESVAAGYLYAPHLTPAGVLGHQLGEVAGPGRFEVVDLARTNETLATMVETAGRALQLDPDVFVVFAGNNWTLLETPEVSPYHEAGRRAYGEALAAAGVMGPVELAARRRLERAVIALAELAAIAASADVRVIVVVPEVNLADWESRQPVTWLAGDGTQRWHALYAEATAALAAGDSTTAAAHAAAMLDLDDGTGPSAFRIMAAAFAAGGDAARARTAAAAEVAADHYASMCFLSAPRAAPMDQEVLRRAKQHGFTVVDLPELFRGHCGAESAGRRMFLDYCHLTREGMRVAMAGVTAAVVAGADGDAPTPAEIVSRVPGPDVAGHVVATARLGAAAHTAHRLLAVDPGNDSIRHWLRSALDADAGVEEAMLDLVAARAAPVPEVLSAAQQRNHASPFALGFQHGWRFGHLDVQLIAAIGDVLADRGRPHSDTIDPLLIGGRAAGIVELVDPADYLWEPAARFYPEVMDLADVTSPAHLRAPWPKTRLAFVAGRAGPVDVALTARLPRCGPADRGPATLTVRVNGRTAATIEVGAAWSAGRCRVPAQAGLNELVVEWPGLPPVGSEMLDSAATLLRRGIAADIHPVFGELFSARVDLR